jgi:hypothetical protein
MGAIFDQVHSWPSWTIGPKAAHAKFGGNMILGGIASVDKRLRLINESFPHDLTSGHFWLEIRTELRGYKHLNNKNAIYWEELVNGIDRGFYPRIAALTVPAFGIPGVEDGAALSPDPAIRKMYRKMHVDAIVKTKWLKANGLGEGVCIWWPAWDSKRMYHGKLEPLTSEMAWGRLVTAWLEICQAAMSKLDKMSIVPDGPLFWLEWKPEVPGQDYLNTIGRAIRFCREVNELMGARVAAINNEWAHLLIGGTTVEDGTRQTVEAGLFTGFVHVNSADLAIVKIDDATGEVLEGCPGDDRDWYVGAGGQKRWDDQRRAVALMLESGRRLICEHDIDPAGDDPLEYYTKSRENLEKMIQDYVQ